MNKCPRCENENLKEDYNYCPVCGVNLGTALEVPVQEQSITLVLNGSEIFRNLAIHDKV
ncbi:hypothetical protein [Clostridium paraputrificum]|uniref:hypothetical protein n=1 Tax=Clostridium paraputrificum TaxID=29363 RepID=UPI00189BF66E|nr:hypothetical protein [Clostridium paraputrificum]MDB2125794.1 hypothetical protein [Clostridium paraputrificum]